MRLRRLPCMVLGHKWAKHREEEIVLAKCRRCGKVTDIDSAVKYGTAWGGSAGSGP